MLSHSALSSADPLLTICSSAFTYSPNDQFAANLKRLLDALSSNTDHNIPNRPGFYNTSLDVLQDRVYGQALCRGDISSHACQECVHSATHYIFTNCNKTDAIIWYELCQVRYSQSPSSAMEVYTGNLLDYNNRENKIVSKKIRFRKALTYLMNNLSTESAFSPSKHMFATGKIEFSKKKTIYGLVQCTMDIPPELCKQCLDSALGELDACCSFRQGGIVLGNNCNAWRSWKDRKEVEFVDPWLMESSPPREVLRCMHIGLLCVQEDPEDRPKMSDVVVLLQGSESVSLSEPKQPAFVLGRLVPSDQSTVYPTMNGLTLSTILPR
ncbi:Protein kinase-like [Trema orientale]|uniref:Protein kinase-like n=1 Tax=Trema orientale TaxID=63057 RepID=A0A2P5EII4_TREOI|nr:Protein kinase-like [Trema orientale]